MKPCKFASNSNRNYQWAVGLYTDWHKNVIKRKSPEMCDTSILKSDVCKPKELEHKYFCVAICKFITEVQTEKETSCQPNTLHDIVASIQSYLHAK